MAKKMIGQRTSLFWVKLEAGVVATIPSRTISLATWDADVTAGNILDLSRAVADGYTLNPTGSDTDDTAMVTDTSNAQRRSGYNYEASFQFAREADPVVNVDSIFEAAFELFKQRGSQGFWVRRIGYLYTAPVAVGQLLSAFKVENDNPRDIETDNGGPIWLEAPFRQLGLMEQFIPVTA